MATVRMTDQRGHTRYTLPVYLLDTTTTDRCMDSLVRLQPRTEKIERERRKNREVREDA